MFAFEWTWHCKLMLVARLTNADRPNYCVAPQEYPCILYQFGGVRRSEERLFFAAHCGGVVVVHRLVRLREGEALPEGSVHGDRRLGRDRRRVANTADAARRSAIRGGKKLRTGCTNEFVGDGFRQLEQHHHLSCGHSGDLCRVGL